MLPRVAHNQKGSRIIKIMSFEGSREGHLEVTILLMGSLIIGTLLKGVF